MTRHEALRPKAGKAFIQQAWTRSTYFIHAGAYKSLFASLAVSTQTNTWHTTKLLLSVYIHLGKFIRGQNIWYMVHTHICIYTYSQNTSKGSAKKKMKGMLFFSIIFLCFSLIKMPVSLSFSFAKVRNWKQHCSRAELSQAWCTATFWRSFEPWDKTCRKTVWQQEAFISSGDNRHLRILWLKRSRL